MIAKLSIQNKNIEFNSFIIKSDSYFHILPFKILKYTIIFFCFKSIFKIQRLIFIFIA